MKNFTKSIKGQFEGNPALSFLTGKGASKGKARETQGKEKTGFKPERSQKLPQGYKINYEVVETKSKRYLLSLQPSLFKQLQAKAKTNKESINDLITRAIEKELKK